MFRNFYTLAPNETHYHGETVRQREYTAHRLGFLNLTDADYVCGIRLFCMVGILRVAGDVASKRHRGHSLCTAVCRAPVHKKTCRISFELGWLSS